MEKFLKKERDKWRCAECGATICCHNGLCLRRYYIDGKAWQAKGLYKWTGVRGGQKETTVFLLSIWDVFFKVTIFVPEKVRADVFSLQLDNEVKLMIADSKQMGKLKYFPFVFDLCFDEMFEAVFSLADFRKCIK